MASLSQLLLNAQAPDRETRNSAVQSLQTQKLEHASQFLVQLAAELSNEAGAKPARQLAGLLLKNTLNNANREEAMVGLWTKVSAEEKAAVRTQTLGSLASADKDVRHSAAQAVSAIALAELPTGGWPELLPILITNASGDNLHFRVSSLLTLGYILEGLQPGQVSKAVSDEVLTALSTNLLAEVQDEVKLEAVKALGHALQFAAQNFKNEAERTHIMKMVLMCCQNQNEGIRLAAFQDLCEIALHYYDYIATHLPDLWTVTSTAIKTGGQKVGSLALEFWNIVADIEKERKEHPNPLKSMRNFIPTASSALLPLLFEGVLQAEEDNDEWSLYKSCGSNLLAVVQLTGNPVLESCLAFITQHLQSANWKQRHAAVLVLGSVLEGPAGASLVPVVADGFKAVLGLMKDQALQVRMTAAWTLSRLCEFHFQQIMTLPEAPLLLKALIDSLSDQAKVAAHACTTAIQIVTKGSFSSLFAPESFEMLFTALMNTAYRPESDTTLQTAAFAAIEALIDRSDERFAGLLEAKLEPLLQLLKEGVGKPGTENSRAFICSILASCFHKVRSQNLPDLFLQATVETLVALFQQQGGVCEEGIHAFGALAQKVKERIVPWLRIFGPSLAFAIGKHEDSSLCKAGTMVIGDLARALEVLIVDFMDGLVLALIQNLQSAEVSTDIKIQSIASIGDLAQAAKGAFLPYIPQVVGFINAAADNSLKLVTDDDSGLFEYFLELREVIVQFYISLLQGLAEVHQADALFPYMPKVVQYAFLTTQEQYKPTLAIHANTLGLVGDIAATYGAKAKAIVCSPVTVNYINWQAAGSNPKIKELARWALGHISSLNSLVG